MCGIAGIVAQHDVAIELYDSLIHLQHRGQDAAGIVCADGSDVHDLRGAGLVREVFEEQSLRGIKGCMGLAHVRYPTSGNNRDDEVQPMIGAADGVSPVLAHNGNVVNQVELARELCARGRVPRSSSDSEIILMLLAERLCELPAPDEDEELIFSALCRIIGELLQKVQGGYSVVTLIPGYGLLAFRDPQGMRPLAAGERVNRNGKKEFIFASEPTMFYPLDFKHVGDVGPGECTFVSLNGRCRHKKLLAQEPRPCVFEYVYFARPDAMLNGISVYRARLRMGQNLARRWKERYSQDLPDIVIPAPFTANTAALSFSHEIGVRYSEGLYKNPFIGRTFIMPTQTQRKKSVRYKLTPQATEIKDKIVLILDDSIVRGTTSREIVRMVREYGARKVYFASAAPPLISPCFYGVDIPSKDELIAAAKDEETIRQFIGADKLLYQTTDDLIEATLRHTAQSIAQPCLACMNGDYPAGDINDQTLETLCRVRRQGHRQTEHKT